MVASYYGRRKSPTENFRWAKKLGRAIYTKTGRTQRELCASIGLDYESNGNKRFAKLIRLINEAVPGSVIMRREAGRNHYYAAFQIPSKEWVKLFVESV